jgi:hypothetical protein
MRLHARASIGAMNYDVYIDGKCTAPLGSTCAWDEAAMWIKRHTVPLTPLRRLADEGETDQTHEAAPMIGFLLFWYKPSPDIRRTLRQVHGWLNKGDHVMISDGVICKN